MTGCYRALPEPKSLWGSSIRLCHMCITFKYCQTHSQRFSSLTILCVSTQKIALIGCLEIQRDFLRVRNDDVKNSPGFYGCGHSQVRLVAPYQGQAFWPEYRGNPIYRAALSLKSRFWTRSKFNLLSWE